MFKEIFSINKKQAILNVPAKTLQLVFTKLMQQIGIATFTVHRKSNIAYGVQALPKNELSKNFVIFKQKFKIVLAYERVWHFRMNCIYFNN